MKQKTYNPSKDEIWDILMFLKYFTKHAEDNLKWTDKDWEDNKELLLYMIEIFYIKEK